MCKVGIIQCLVHFEETEVVEREGGGGDEEKIQRDEKEKNRVEKGKWGNRGLSKLGLRQNGEGS
jgi:hypothetical protein